MLLSLNISIIFTKQKIICSYTDYFLDRQIERIKRNRLTMNENIKKLLIEVDVLKKSSYQLCVHCPEKH